MHTCTHIPVLVLDVRECGVTIRSQLGHLDFPPLPSPPLPSSNEEGGYTHTNSCSLTPKDFVFLERVWNLLVAVDVTEIHLSPDLWQKERGHKHTVWASLRLEQDTILCGAVEEMLF